MTVLADRRRHDRRHRPRRRRARARWWPRATRSSPSTSPGRAGSSTPPRRSGRPTLEAVRAVLTQVDGAELRAVGITNQRETILLWDRETLGSPRRAIVWQDRRTADICDRLRDDGHEERVTELTGLRLDPYFSGTKLMWLAEHEPQTWALVEEGRYAVGTVDSYLVARMTRGTWHVTDVSNASRTLLIDLSTGDWSDELCSLFGVPRDALPDLVAQLGRGRPRPTPRSFCGLSLPIAGLAGDQQSALFGQTCFDVGRRQVHLRHRLVHPHQHRHDAGAVGRRPAVHGRLALTRRRADLRPRGRDLRDRRRRAVAARRAADRRLGRRDRGRRGDRPRHRRGRLRAGPDRARRPPLGPARPRHDHRHHSRHDPRPPRPRDARGDRLRGARRAGDDAGRRHRPTAARRRRRLAPTTCSARSRPTRSAGWSNDPGSWRPRAWARRSWPASASASGSPPTTCARPGSSTAPSTRPTTAPRADASHARWLEAVERARGWAE